MQRETNYLHQKALKLANKQKLLSFVFQEVLNSTCGKANVFCLSKNCQCKVTVAPKNKIKSRLKLGNSFTLNVYSAAIGVQVWHMVRETSEESLELESGLWHLQQNKTHYYSTPFFDSSTQFYLFAQKLYTADKNIHLRSMLNVSRSLTRTETLECPYSLWANCQQNDFGLVLPRFGVPLH